MTVMLGQEKALPREVATQGNALRQVASSASVALIPLGFLLTLGWLVFLGWSIYAVTMRLL